MPVTLTHTRLPLNPADIRGSNVQARNTGSDRDGNVTVTFSRKDPEDGAYLASVCQKD